MTKTTYKEYCYVEESVNVDIGDIHRDEALETFAKFSLPDHLHDSVKAMYNDKMDKTSLRVIKMHNNEGRVEYHIHSYDVHPFSKSNNESKESFQHALKMIHDDAKSEIESGKEIQLQTIEGSERNNSIKAIAQRLAARANANFTDAGLKPLTTAPFLSGNAYIISKKPDATS